MAIVALPTKNFQILFNDSLLLATAVVNTGSEISRVNVYWVNLTSHGNIEFLDVEAAYEKLENKIGKWANSMNAEIANPYLY